MKIDIHTVISLGTIVMATIGNVMWYRLGHSRGFRQGVDFASKRPPYPFPPKYHSSFKHLMSWINKHGLPPKLYDEKDEQ